MKLLTSIFLVLFLFSCEDKEPRDILSADWSIDKNYLRKGCFTGKDCIPSIQRPNKSAVDGNFLTFLYDNTLVIGIWDGNNYIAYPHPILDWHEIINENGYCISYCPLTGSALHLETDSDFGVSGLLYYSNLIMYDRETDSHWPQMLLKSAEGSQEGEELVLKSMIETTWSTWKKLFPESLVVNSITGYFRNYNAYPYGQYRTCNSFSCGDYIYFPVPFVDERLPAKTRVLSIISDNAQKAYPIDDFQQPTILNESVDGKNYAVILSANEQLGVAFETSSDLSIFTWDPENSIILIEDENGNQWNILGRSINGETDDLITARAFISYWFAQAAFYPDTDIHS